MIRFQLPPPANWQDFEALCRDLFADIWKDPSAQKNGRQGQPQCGVDVFGSLMGAGKWWFGVQCKLLDRLGSQGISNSILRAEATAALNFSPPLTHFVLAHTGPRDVRIQEYARSFEARRFGERKYLTLIVYSWEDVQDAVSVRTEIVRRHYPQFFHKTTEAVSANRDNVTGTIYGQHPFQECSAIFDSVEVKSAIAEPLRIELRNVMTELALNAFEHGLAIRCQINLSPSTISFEDDGTQFDALEFCRHYEKTGAGLTYLKGFIYKHRKQLTAAKYERLGESNRITLTFSEKLSSPLLTQPCVILLRAKDGYDKNATIAISPNCRDYFFTVSKGFFHPSGLVVFVDEVLRRLPHDAVLHIDLSHEDLLKETLVSQVANGYFDPARLLIE